MARWAITPERGFVGLRCAMTVDPFMLVLTAYLFMAAVMVGLWGLRLWVRNVSITDVGWCAGLIAVVQRYATQATDEIWLQW